MRCGISLAAYLDHRGAEARRRLPLKKSESMKRLMIALPVVLAVAGLTALVGTQQPGRDAAAGVAINADDIGGAVRSPAGPSARP